MRQIPLTNIDKLALVDDDIFEYLSQWNWFYAGGYAARWQRMGNKYKLIKMHREVINTPEGMITDHKNRNKLDNRIENLRICDYCQNNNNTKQFSTNTSGYRGVSWNNVCKKWLAYIAHSYKNYYLGSFDNKEDAAIAWNEAAKELKGEFATLNKIKEEV